MEKKIEKNCGKWPKNENGRKNEQIKNVGKIRKKRRGKWRKKL